MQPDNGLNNNKGRIMDISGALPLYSSIDIVFVQCNDPDPEVPPVLLLHRRAAGCSNQLPRQGMPRPIYFEAIFSN